MFIDKEPCKPYTTIARAWTRLRKAGAQPHLRLRDLGHNYASFLVNDGTTLLEVKEILGHQDPKTSLRYTQLAVQTLRDASASASAAIARAAKEAP